MTIDPGDPGAGSEPCVAVFTPVLMLYVDVHCSGDGDTEIHLHAGGQGYWISRMIQALGVTVIPCAAVGGEPGHALRAIVESDGMPCRLIDSARPNPVVVEDHRDGRRIVAETAPPSLGRHEVDELYSATVGAALRAGICVLAGAHLAPVVGDDHVRRLVADLRRNGVTVIADVSGGPLRAALGSGLDVVKVSHEELVGNGFAGGDSVAATIEGIERVRRSGAAAVVVSRSERSTIAGFDDRVVEVRSPHLEVLDGRGGGDSMTAALAVAAARGQPFEDALRLAAAAGSLNVSRHGLGSGRRDSIEEIAQRVELRPARPRGPRAGHRAGLAALTRRALYDMARRHDVRGRSAMTKSQLVAALSEDRC